MRRVVGIDLGTTHTALAWAEEDAAALPEAMPIAQLVSASLVATRPLLPSCLYAPLDGEPAGDPFCDAPWVCGEHARRRAAEVPGRAVTSAKSWLCHAAIDRTAPTLPWGAADESAPRVSPLEASTRFLVHVTRAYEAQFPGRSLRDERVVLTVPASFDDVARELTLRAARDAGLSVTLLEEPQAAFYDYLRHGTELRALADARGGRADVLVCDVGGGTTDLSLVRASSVGEDLAFERVAVGRHILLGGDNMDLALAHLCEPRLGSGKLDAARFAQLVLAARGAKETLLAQDAPESAEVSLAGRGSSLVGAMLRATLTRDEVASVILEGFFPKGVDQPAAKKGGFVSMGLPFERDVAITRHVRAFAMRAERDGHRVDAVLYNGGVFRSKACAARVAAALGEEVVMLPSADPDLAVAKGAARYALARLGKATRIRSGTTHACYVGVAGREPPVAVCVLPKGALEHEVHRVDLPGLALKLGSAVRFDFFVSDDRGADRAGDLVTVDEALVRLPPLATHFGSAHHGREENVAVALVAELAATGTLSVECRETAGDRAFSLSFDLRGGQRPAKSSAPPPPSARSSSLERAVGAVEAAFGRGGSAEPKELQSKLEHLLGKRGTWDAAVSRALFDALAKTPGSRRRSVDHERAFFSLAGYCLRPGYGFLGDDRRSGLMGKLFAERLGFPEEMRGWQQFFVAYRRVAGGLDEATQTAMRDLLDGVIAPKTKKIARSKKFSPLAEGELVELASSLERVPWERRAELGEWLLERTWAGPSPGLWACIGRIGAREPAYAGPERVVAAAVVERWLEHLLKESWTSVSTAAVAARSMARLTGDRARDVSPRLRAEVMKKLTAAGLPADFSQPLSEHVAVTETERSEFYGENLPLGLSLLP